MRRFRPFLILLVIAFSFITPIASGQTLGAVLTGSGEVPPNSNPGFGNATVTFDESRQHITVTITVTNLGSPINNFHIHEAPPGTNGPVRVDLIGLGGTFVNGTMNGTFSIAADVAQRMLQNPANFYVNVHTVAFPGGAVRGQLAFASGGAITYAADLRPTNEVPPANSSAYGSALVTFDPINSMIAFEVNTHGIANPTMSHIHRGAAGTNGPVIINFATSAGQIAGGRVSGAGPVATFQSGNLLASDLTNLANPANAGNFYVNVHSTAFPGGEIRGQLTPANEYDIAIAGRVTNGLGQTFVTDVRVFNPSYTSHASALLEYFPAGLDPNATANRSIVVDIAPRGTAVLDDIAGAEHLNVSGTTGALRVTSATQLAVTSRVYVDRRAEDLGTLGQFVPAHPRANALRRGVMPHLSNQTDLSTGFRTNIGFFNPTQSDVTVRLELRDDDGALIEQTSLGLRALSQQQRSITSYFPALGLLPGTDVTVSFDVGAPIFVYGAVNDNVSGDAMLVPAQPDSGVAASQ